MATTATASAPAAAASAATAPAATAASASATSPPPYVPVSQWYADRSVFVTGGTGFMGKVLVEKLLRSCPGISNIYLLMRPKRGQDVSARLTELLSSPLFETLRRERPHELNKIVPIQGDVTEPELGISASDQKLLISTVSVVFHSAATVKFDEALKLSVTINMLGTKRLVELCQGMMKLEALIHVSTAYCNCDRTEVAEVIYPPPYEPKHIIQCMEWMGDDLIQAVTPRLLGGRPNTYTFTKAMAEKMLLDEAGDLPVAIVRPSIVLSSLREPVEGWVDNWNGPTGIIAAVGKGFFRSMLCHGAKVADLVPVDIVINLMIAAAWRTGTTPRSTNGIAVYNCATGMQNPITWKEFVDNSLFFVRKHPLSNMLWYPDGQMHTSWLLNRVSTTALHMVPALALDAAARLTGRKPYMGRVQANLDKAARCLEYFSTQQWRFCDDNVRRLDAQLSPADRATFPFDVKQINWPAYIENYVLGIRQFIFKEHPSSEAKCRRQLNK